jgi:hypothetical protein
MPERMSEMWAQLGAPGKLDEDWSVSLRAWGGIPPATVTTLGAPLFPRFELAPQS